MSRTESWFSAAFLAVGAAALGRAVQVANGNWNPEAGAFLTVALAAATVAVAAPSWVRWERWSRWGLTGFAGLAVLFQFVQLLSVSPGMYLRVGPGAGAIFGAQLVGAAFVCGAAMSEKPWLSKGAMVLALGVHFALGVWLLHASPSPNIDVFTFHQKGIEAFLHGHSPYSVVMPNIYGGSAFYGDGIVQGDHLTIGFPYPPFSLLLATAGSFLGDYRFANLLAMTGAAALLWAARGGWMGRAAALLLLFTPRFLFVLEQGWTEPLVVLCLAATMFCACRWPKAWPWALGLLFAVKQHMVLLAPLTLLLMPRPLDWRAWAKAMAKAVGLAALLTVPFMAWDFSGFWTSVVMFQIRQPLRTDALSYLAHWISQGSDLPLWLGFVALVPAGALALWRAPRSPAGFAAGAALLYVAFFAFSKQAFCNYYYFAIGTLCTALAATRPGLDRYTPAS